MNKEQVFSCHLFIWHLTLSLDTVLQPKASLAGVMGVGGLMRELLALFWVRADNANRTNKRTPIKSGVRDFKMMAIKMETTITRRAKALYLSVLLMSLSGTRLKFSTKADGFCTHVSTILNIDQDVYFTP